VSKLTILVFVGYYLPGYKSGGPVRTIANMVDCLGDVFDFRIVTKDRDSLEIEAYENVQIDTWNKVGKSMVYYASPKSLSITAFCRLIRNTPHDVLYFNSFLHPYFTFKPLVARRLGLIPIKPVVIAPRGEFSSGSLAIKRWKKKAYILLVKLFGLYQDLIWQASSEYEAADIQKNFGCNPACIRIAPDLLEQLYTEGIDSCCKFDIKESLRIVFLSRITPIKNLDFALKVIKKVNIPVEFNIYGVIDDESYWQRCQVHISKMPSQVTVNYYGSVEHESVPQVLSKHDLFILPTLGENFGHVIFESLAAGVPPLISDQTPWQDLDYEGVGWVRNLGNIRSFRDVIETLFEVDSNERMAQRKRAMQYARKLAQSEVLRIQNIELFKNIFDTTGRAL